MWRYSESIKLQTHFGINGKIYQNAESFLCFELYFTLIYISMVDHQMSGIGERQKTHEASKKKMNSYNNNRRNCMLNPYSYSAAAVAVEANLLYMCKRHM